MPRNPLLALVVGLIAVGAPSSEADVHLVAEGANSAFDAAPVFSCLAYQGCAKTGYTLGAGGRLHIYTSKSVATVLLDLERCDFSSANVTQLYYLEEGTNKATTLDPNHYGLFHPERSKGATWPNSKRASIRREPKTTSVADLNPAIISENRKERLKLLARASVSDPLEEAITRIVGGLGASSLGYSLSVAKLGDNAAAVTDHDQRTIQFDVGVLRSDLARVVRHEFDHVFQFRISNACGAVNAFATHEARERAAYLNDGHFSADNESYATRNILRYPPGL